MTFIGSKMNCVKKHCDFIVETLKKAPKVSTTASKVNTFCPMCMFFTLFKEPVSKVKFSMCLEPFAPNKNVQS